MWIAACVAGLAAVGSITDICLAGLDKAAALAGVVVGLVELAALVLGVYGAVQERRSGLGAA